MKRYKANKSINSWRIDCPCGNIVNGSWEYHSKLKENSVEWTCSECGQRFEEINKTVIMLEI